MERSEVLEILEKYDPECREYLKYNAYAYGISYELYAIKLKEINDGLGSKKKGELK